MANNLQIILVSIIVALSAVTIVSSSDRNSNNNNEDVEYLNSVLDSYLSDPSLYQRQKKSRNDEDERPLMKHSRKNYFGGESSSSSSCQLSDMKVEANVMVDSKSSTANGARYLRTEKIQSGSGSDKISLIQMREQCGRMCCEDEDGCDTALLSLQLGDGGYRCYLFKCSSHCIFIKHPDYVVLQTKLPEQQPDNKDLITTGQNTNKNLCNMKYEFKCASGDPKCIPIYDVCDSIPHCSDKSDEANCTTSSSLVSSSTSRNVPSVGGKKKPPKTEIIDDTENTDQPLYNAQPSDDDDYDEYTLKSIISHLKELEDSGSRKKQKDDNKSPVFKTPEGYLDSFMRPGLTAATTKKTTTKKQTTKSSTTKKFNFHDNLNSEDGMYGPKTNDERLTFRDDEESRWSVHSGTTSAIVLLVLGCSLVVAFFVYVILSTRFVRKIKWVGDKLPGVGQKNVDVDGDYLINGMYL